MNAGSGELGSTPHDAIIEMLATGGVTQEAVVSLLATVLAASVMGYKELFSVMQGLLTATQEGASGSLTFTWGATRKDHVRVNHQTGTIKYVRLDGE